MGALSERAAWGTVREDYSADGAAWEYFPHDHARSRAYRWGEDGLAGICDDRQHLCFALALWNGHDPILKERLFGLTNGEGQSRRGRQGVLLLSRQHADALVHEVLYKYPQAAYPYADLVDENRQRGAQRPRVRTARHRRVRRRPLLRCLVEYAKATPEDILIRITVENRGPEAARAARAADALVPQYVVVDARARRQARAARSGGAGGRAIVAAIRSELGERCLYAEGAPELLFTENETNASRLFGARTRSRSSRTASTITSSTADATP